MFSGTTKPLRNENESIKFNGTNLHCSLNSSFKSTDESIKINNIMFVFDTFQWLMSTHKYLSLTGNRTKTCKSALNISLKANNFNILNSTSKTMHCFYGKLS